ncbi:hypothetical protein MH117_09700 [Paenibacillus sp. ACRRX]|uniref:hypothetical protein n=1 Tax=Paenibacillus sp. ACRRX TaxID=2918206 RepID=UPI001EF5388E|nr:hypothetical protein [Paenibacillus sp. ACRRX]MCG7407697.1 hypothetical protein [Paenibacillus sp. ACRRX]
MAKYQARPFYEVKIGKQTVVFDYFGLYVTEETTIVAELDTLVPGYIQRIDEPETIASEVVQPKEDEPEPEAPTMEQPQEDESKPEEKPSTRRKASAK